MEPEGIQQMESSLFTAKVRDVSFFSFLNRWVSLKLREFISLKFHQIINSKTHQILSVGDSSIP
jgi:hypothetical protein